LKHAGTSDQILSIRHRGTSCEATRIYVWF